MAVYRPTKNGKVYWMDFIFTGQRIKESTHTRSKTLAIKIEQRRRRQLEEGAAGVRKLERPKLFSVAAEKWIASNSADWAHSTLRMHRTGLGHLARAFGKILVCDIEAGDVAQYQQRRRAAGASARTVNMEVGTLRGILKEEGRWGSLQGRVKLFREDPKGKGRKLEPAEQDALLRACAASPSRQLFPFVVLALETGARYGTIRNARWQQVNFDARSITWGHDKTDAGTDREVPLTPRALATITQWAAQFPKRQPRDYIFPAEKIAGIGRRGPQGRREDARFSGCLVHGVDPALPVGSIATAWESARRRAGVRCRFHDLRHSAASRMIAAGVPLPKVAKILGWAPSTMVLMAARYGHFSLEELRAAVEAGSQPEAAKIGAESLNFPPNFSASLTAENAN